MKKITLPKNYNYIGCFLTFRCQLDCSYCINKFGKFKPDIKELSTRDWIKGLSRIKTRKDLPITLQGGEPSLYPGFYKLVNALYKREQHLDLLTNGLFDAKDFSENVSPKIFRRNAPYAGIRFSFHGKTHPVLAQKIWFLQNRGYEVGVWTLKNHYLAVQNSKMKGICKWLNIDCREKEFLGWVDGKLSGTYKYPDACLGKTRKKVLCKTSELLINPAGNIFRCHAELYANRNPIGHILDKKIKFPDFLECNNYGHCHVCDWKITFDRFQRPWHCSVETKKIK